MKPAELINELTRYTAQMSRRERLLVLGAGAAMVVFVLSIVFGSLSRSIADREARIEEKLQSLQQVAVYAQSFNESERTRKELEQKLGGAPISLLTHMQGLADKHGLGIGSMSDRGENKLGGVKESVVELQIANAPLDKLTALVNDVERSHRIVKLRKLRVHKNAGETKALNVTLTVATYRLAEGS